MCAHSSTLCFHARSATCREGPNQVNVVYSVNMLSLCMQIFGLPLCCLCDQSCLIAMRWSIEFIVPEVIVAHLNNENG